jgi:Rab-like protein 5
LADATEIPYDYRPTQGVRILEFEVNDIEVNNKRITRDIELWDCSGNYKYRTFTVAKLDFNWILKYICKIFYRFKHCWPAIRKDIHGVILVYSTKTQDSSKELKELYDYFVNEAKLEPNSCVIFYFDPDNTSNTSKIICKYF